jgi:hypothetical protein
MNYTLSAVFLLLVSMPLAPHAASSSEPTDLSEIVRDAMRYLDFDASLSDALMQGEILFTGMPKLEVLDEEIAVAGAMLIINRPMADIVEFALSGAAFQAHSNLIAFKQFSREPNDKTVTRADFDGIAYTEEEADELDKLLASEPATTFNLGADEHPLFRALEKTQTDLTAAASAIYANILLKRYQAYSRDGTAGIKPYARKSGATVSAGHELLTAAKSSWFVKKHFPDFYEKLLLFPAGSDDELEHRFYWLKQRLRERPVLVLSHQMVQLSDEYTLGVERKYYVGHSYNSMSTTTGLIPLEQGTLVISATRTFTDQVLGFARGIKQRQGRKLIASKKAEYFRKLREQLEREH